MIVKILKSSGSFPAIQYNEQKIHQGIAERVELRNFGYLQAISQYTPGDSFVYYFGASWSKYGLKSFDEWVEHIRQFNRRLVTPLKVSIVENK